MVLKNNKGFALVLMMALLPVLLAVFIAVFAVIGFMQIDQRFQYACRREGIQGQERVAPLLTALLKMNTQAMRLKIQEERAKAQAIAAAGTPAFPAAEAAFIKVQNQRIALGIRQRQIITQGDLLLMSAHSQGTRELQKSATQLGGYKSLFSTSNLIKPGVAPRLAVRPDSTDIAPTYSLEKNFEEKQALAHSWQYRLSLQPQWRGFISGNFSFENSCAVTLKEENSKWIPKIRKAKS